MIKKDNIGQYLLSIIANASKLFRALNLIVFAKIFGTMDFGIYVLCWAFTEIISKLSIFGMSAASLPYLNQLKSKHPQVDRFYVVHSIALCGVLFAFGIASLVSSWSHEISMMLFEKDDVGHFLKDFIWILPVFTTNRMYNYMFRHLQNLKYEMITQGFIEPVSVLCFVFLLKNRFGLQALAYAHFASLFLTTFLFVFYSFTEFQRKENVLAYLKSSTTLPWLDFFKTSFASFVNSSTVILGQQVNTLMVGRFMPISAAGIYAVCYELAAPMRKIYFILEPVIEPIFAKANSPKDLEAELSDLVAMLTLVFALVFSFYLSFGKNILSLFNPEFVAGYAALLLLCFSQIFFFLVKISESLSFMQGRARLSNVITISTLGISVAFSYVLVPRLGLVGAGMASVLTYALASVGSIALVTQRLRLKINPLKHFAFSKSTILLCFMLALLCAAGTFVVPIRFVAYFIFPIFAALLIPKIKSLYGGQFQSN